MSDGSVGPWWFAAVVAGITASATTLSAWVTNHYASKRATEQLEAQREQFTAQMAAQHNIENIKLLHDKRQKLYSELRKAVYSTSEKIDAMALELEGEGEPQGEWKIIPNAHGHLGKLRELSLDCEIIGSQEVAKFSRVAVHMLEDISRKYDAALSESANFGVIAMWDSVLDAFYETTELMRRDLGVVE
ncbi:hypothetical protein [Amycolatopsis sp. Poz14]|uniref:hypothetical protein n=1 Tax=Amycolatopsis sp. Poz14 TaxID=1447705 RepID=UPI001EE83F05|nr:hypothetical protein [Amycolatopsis sp. Poz14]MCG3754677.1 hypothetical protein [Amycolatopsis sp. Poz14]